MPSKRKPGRPVATDKPDVVSLLVGAFRDGLSVRQACIQSGISHAAVYACCCDDQKLTDMSCYGAVGCRDIRTQQKRPFHAGKVFRGDLTGNRSRSATPKHHGCKRCLHRKVSLRTAAGSSHAYCLGNPASIPRQSRPI